MRLVTDNRASKILHDTLLSRHFSKPFLLPSNVCGIIPQTFSLAHIPFDLIDIDPSTLCIDLSVSLNTLDRYSGILYVHTYGVENRPETIFQVIKEKNPEFLIIDDCCLCMPQLTPPDTAADVILYSVGPKKQVNMGQGGFAYMSDACSYKRAPLSPNSIFDDSPWSLDGNILLRNRQKSMSHKKKLNAIYSENLPSEIQLPPIFQNWRFNILVDNKNEILDSLFAEGLFGSSHYQSQAFMYGQSSCPNADYLSEHVINLFNDQYYTDDMAIRTCSIINRHI